MVLNDRKPVIIFASFAALGLLIGFLCTPSGLPALPLCAFKVMTGLPCPGCGLTRAVCALGHGQIDMAMKYHPFVLVIYPVMVGLTAYPFVMGRIEESTRQRLDRLFFYACVVGMLLMTLYNFYRWYMIFTTGAYSYI